jgi:Tol biopolymer transport system component|tara:strand:+ start:167 stop:1243 length:1077 start_codon:yes stop_codon:yes gene_type:complete
MSLKKLVLLAFLVILFSFSAASVFDYAFSESASSGPFHIKGEKHLKNIKMLTNGGENAEAYLSFNEEKLIYQASTGSLKCDQIFTMNINGSNKKMVSTGKGKTTCAYFLPGDKKMLYASTHLADNNCPPPPDRSMGYVWKLYDSFDIFLADTDGPNLKRLTDSPGYDAEATVSPAGNKIVFTSTRDGDPEIYTMDLDGSNQTRLTFLKGYDGGPFFSLDGSKIVFRASRPKTEQELKDYDELVKDGLVRPSVLEVYVMDADGKNMKRVTDFGKASFAPFFHPDGKRIIFSSNINSKSGRNFDLYIVNIDGTGLEQVTFNETFDGFPMFTKDGKHLVFASNRSNNKKRETNIFTAEWVE